MEKEILNLISSFDMSLKSVEIRLKAFESVLAKTNPELHDLYSLEFYRLWKEFETSLTPEKRSELENFGFEFPVLY